MSQDDTLAVLGPPGGLAPPANDERTLTRLLQAWSEGDAGALDSLAPRVYDELARLARSYLRRERTGHTLETSALVHEAFLRLCRQNRLEWQSRTHFFGIAAQMMRRVLVDHARSRRSARHGRDPVQISLTELGEVGHPEVGDLLAVDEALTELARPLPDHAKVVELKFFGGLSNEEVAQVLAVSVPTVARRWRLARAWLFRYLAAQDC